MCVTVYKQEGSAFASRLEASLGFDVLLVSRVEGLRG